MPFCISCGHQIPEESKFCSSCGAKFPEKQEQPTIEPARMVPSPSEGQTRLPTNAKKKLSASKKVLSSFAAIFLFVISIYIYNNFFAPIRGTYRQPEGKGSLGFILYLGPDGTGYGGVTGATENFTYKEDDSRIVIRTQSGQEFQWQIISRDKLSMQIGTLDVITVVK
jgi:hypothetical protein